MDALSNFITSLTTGLQTIWAFLVGFFDSFFGNPPLPPFAPPVDPIKNNFSVDLLRADDLLVAHLDFYNLTLVPPQGGQPLRLVPATDDQTYIVMRLPQQSFGEQSFFENGIIEKPSLPPVSSRMSGNSWLVFRVTTLTPIPYTIADILTTLSKAEMLVKDEIGFPMIPPPPGDFSQSDFVQNGRIFSAIEAPYRLFLSPHRSTRWAHSPTPVTNEDKTRTELWQTRLGVDSGTPGKVNEKDDTNRTARAVWSPDYDPTNKEPLPSTWPFRMSLDQKNRHDIVRVTADKNLPGHGPVNVQQLMLSALGAWLKVYGEWNPDVTGMDIEEWQHLMTLGRDHFVRVVERGFYFPTSHRASLITITERKFQQTVEMGMNAGYLRTREFIMLREPVKTYSHRESPFRSVAIRPLVTPNLNPSKLSEILPGLDRNAFWPQVGAVSTDFQCNLTATDWEGRTVEFMSPLAFVMYGVATNQPGAPATAEQIVSTYNAYAETDPRRQRDLGGQSIAYAPSVDSGDTTLETAQITFGAKSVSDKPRFLPTMYKANVDVPAVKQLLGASVPSTIQWEDSYTRGGGSEIGNAGDVFVRVLNKPAINFDVQKAGGLVTPNIGITSLSRAFGPMGGDASQFVNGNFKPKDVFDLSVQMLGGIKLSDIINDMVFGAASAVGANVPNLTTTRKMVNGADTIEVTYQWVVPKLASNGDPLLLDNGLFHPNDGAQFSIQAIVDKPLNGSPPTFQINGALTNFGVTLIPSATLVELTFNSVTFNAVQDRKVDVSVDFAGMQFKGVLQFVNALTSVIPLDGFNDPPYLDVIPPPDEQAGVDVGYTFGIPTIGVGAFTLQNISLLSGFYLPFVGKPMNLHFGFCSREQPFILTVYGLGGGGFMSFDIGIAGVTMVEASLEFGASVALNLGVAAGSATVMGGFYYQKAGAGFTISAFIRAEGDLEVLGIISVSVEFYIALSYTSKEMGGPHAGTLYGEATLTVKIKIAFFSKSVDIGMEREISGSDPKFIDAVAQTDWALYCDAFADYLAV